MQYILTEEEYRELTLRKDTQLGAATVQLQEVCTLAALHTPVPRPWAEDKTPQPWGCILVEPSPWYCDDCPVSRICPNPNKRWSQ